MGLFARLFKRKKPSPQLTEYLSAEEFNHELASLLAEDRYLARSDYAPLLTRYRPTYDFYFSLLKGGSLDYYVKAHGVKKERLTAFLSAYEDLLDLSKGSKKVKAHNERFIASHLVKDKQYLEDLLKEVDPNIKLDEQQQTAILSDEDHTLLIAGAGAGKTTTLAAKARYLVEREGVKPEDILIISFTNKAVNELRERINVKLSLPCVISTFHSIGFSLLRNQNCEKPTVKDEDFLYFTIIEYLKENVLTNQAMLEKIILFFASYLDIPYQGKDLEGFLHYLHNRDFPTLKGYVEQYNEAALSRIKGKRSLQGECLRSNEEVRIANFLYVNGIDYRYEAIYPYHIYAAKKPYTPDFRITQGDKVAYIEHFGINEDGTHSFYSPTELARYKQEINDKVKLHREHKTTLLYTFSHYKDGKDFLLHLQEQLKQAGFELRPIDREDLFKKLLDNEESRYVGKLARLLSTFISSFKRDGYRIDSFAYMRLHSPSPRTKLFLDIAESAYLYYQQKLNDQGAIDFSDMINKAASLLEEMEKRGEKLSYRYIIVDEYQDISRERFDLIKALKKVSAAKIVAVGDDWQSIYRFSGSDVTLFTRFQQLLGYAEQLFISKTYRNSQEVIDIAGSFVQKNEAQIKKTLLSPKHIRKPVVIQTYEEGKERDASLSQALEEMIGKVLLANKQEGKRKDSSILLIGRYNFDAAHLCKSGQFVYADVSGRIFSKKYPSAKIEFLTAHSSKGLGYDNVIIVNGKEGTYGFPSQIDDDPILKLVIKDDEEMEYAEERRLFYVALTRTKNRVFILCPEQRASRFVLELIKDYPEVTLHGKLTKTEIIPKRFTPCPVCGYPLTLRYNRNYGLKLYMCTNEPELCGFITNDLAGLDMGIEKCDCCQDGYLIVKSGKSTRPFLGCTCYKPDGSGCNRTVSYEVYKRGFRRGYEQLDCSLLPRYEIQTGDAFLPEAKSHKGGERIDPTKRIKYLDYRDIYQVVADDEGQILTDTKLLDRLIEDRGKKAKEKGLNAHSIVSDKGLVSLATYKPSTLEEWLSLPGLGKQSYLNFASDYLKAKDG